MRKLMCLAAFCVMMLATVAGSQPPTCDGTKQMQGKCNNGEVPAGYYEETKCQGDIDGVVGCLHAIAFNMDDFYCSAPEIDEGYEPPAYTSYCADSKESVECTHKRICKGVVMPGPGGTQFTKCSQDGDKTVTYRLKKQTLSGAFEECSVIAANP